LHDVGDKKYLQPGEDVEIVVCELLLKNGASEALAARVQTVVKHVSFSAEKRDPQIVQDVLKTHPELAIVQDADRLDAIGAIGIGRTFTFGGAKRSEGGMQGTIDHFHEKLELLETMMKVKVLKAGSEKHTDSSQDRDW